MTISALSSSSCASSSSHSDFLNQSTAFSEWRYFKVLSELIPQIFAHTSMIDKLENGFSGAQSLDEEEVVRLTRNVRNLTVILEHALRSHPEVTDRVREMHLQMLENFMISQNEAFEGTAPSHKRYRTSPSDT